MAKMKTKQEIYAERKKEESKSKRIEELEEELRKTKYNKRTQHHIGLVKAKLAELKRKEESKKGVGKAGGGYAIRKTGDATVIMLGFPSVGKSTLLNALTNAESEVGDYEFTTLDVIPGMLNYKQAKIQIFDVPGVVEGAASGRGRGREVLGVIRNADMVMVLVDATKVRQYKVLLEELIESHIRINQKKPDIHITKTPKGGIRVGTNIKLTHLNPKLVKDIAREMKIINADILIRTDVTVDGLIDAIEGNKAYLPGIIVLNKIDLANEEELERVRRKIKPDIEISATDKTHIEELKEMIFQKLEFARIYLKEVGKKPDMEEPILMRKGCTVKDVCHKLHADFETKFSFVRVWGPSAKFDGQRFLKIDKGLQDMDIIEIHKD